MLRVMSITNLCDFLSNPAPVVRRPMEFRGLSEAFWQGYPAKPGSGHGILRLYFLRLVMFCCALQLAGCTPEREPPPDLVNEIYSLEQRTVSPDGSLQGAASIIKEPMAIEANWKIRISSRPKYYFDWGEQSATGPNDGTLLARLIAGLLATRRRRIRLAGVGLESEAGSVRRWPPISEPDRLAINCYCLSA
jgi:hypothetical protein